MRDLTVREKLYDYIRFADKKKVRALYTLVEKEIKSKKDYWESPDFIKGLEESVAEYEADKHSLKNWEYIKSERN